MNIFKEAIDHFGTEKQIIKTIEELAELQQALCKYLLYGTGNVEEEIADVSIMLCQMEHIFNDREVARLWNEKINRLKKLLADKPSQI